MVRSRLRVLMAIVALAFLAVAARLAQVQLLEAPAIREAALERRRDLQWLAPKRGEILDRAGRPLAVNRHRFDAVFTLAGLFPRELIFAELQKQLGLCEEEPKPEGDAMCVCGVLESRIVDWYGGPAAVARLAASPEVEAPLCRLIERIPPGALERLSSEFLADLRRAGHELREEADGLRALWVAPRSLFHTEIALARLAAIAGAVPESLVEPVRAAAAKLRALGLNRTGRSSFRRQMRHELCRDLSFEAAGEVLSDPERFPGIDIVWRRERHYPSAEAAAIVTGYLGRIGEKRFAELQAAGELLDRHPDDLDAAFDSFPSRRERGRFEDEELGLAGLEQRYDERLRGRWGLRLVLRDARNRLRAQPGVAAIEPNDGEELRCTLDLELQTALHAALAEECRLRRAGPAASAVVLDLGARSPSGGDAAEGGIAPGAVLALVTYPTFDPNRMLPGKAAAYLAELQADAAAWEHGVFSNRPLSAFLDPGSIFKLAVAAAAMESGRRIVDGQARPARLDPREQVQCRRVFDERFPDMYRCHSLNSHHEEDGYLDLSEALKFSCNTYFYQLGKERLSAADLAAWSRLLGFGRAVELDLGLSAGPGPAGRLREEVRPYGLLAYCIGQEHVTASPLQAARMVAAIALGDRVPWPYLVSPRPPEPILLGAATLATLRNGMRRAFCERGGTAHKPELEGFDAAAKTGTAETGREGKHFAWSAGFAPSNRPQIAFVVCLEDTNAHGGDATAPIVARILSHFAAADRRFLVGEGPP